MFKRRLAIVLVLGAAYFLLLLLRLFQFQVIEASKWKAQAAQLGRRELRLPARRGEILDRDGIVLAADRLQIDLSVKWSEFDAAPWDCAACGRPTISLPGRRPSRCPACGMRSFSPGKERDLASLPGLLGITPEEFDALLAAARAECVAKADREYERRTREGRKARRSDVDRVLRRWWYVVTPDVREEVVREVSLDPRRYRGLGLRPTYRRVREVEGALKPIVGAVSGIYEEKATPLRVAGVGWGEIFRMRFGRSGLEKVFQQKLSPKEGLRVVDRDATGRVREVLLEDPARDGQTVATSLSHRLTGIVTESLGEACRDHDAEGGAFVAIDPRSGEVLVLGQWPPEGAGVHRVLSAVVPGSVYKVVTALAGLLSEELDPDALFACEGTWRGIGCHGITHEKIGLEEAITHSCNGYFGHAAEKMGNELLSHWARELGFGERTGLGIPGEDRGRVPDDAWKSARHDADPDEFPYAKLHAGEIRQIGFGQGYTMVTPVQVARLMAVLANGGRDVTPTLVLGGEPLGRQVVPGPILDPVRRGLEEVVVTGTAKDTGLRRFHAAGKTGTAEVGEGDRNMAWFAGYAPAKEPRVAFACYLSKAQASGAAGAGPVVLRFLEEHLER